MPATSEKQRIAIIIAEKHPEKLFKRNRGLLSMTSAQRADYIHEPVAPKPKKRPSAVYGDD